MPTDLRTALTPPYLGLPLPTPDGQETMLAALPQPNCEDTPWMSRDSQGAGCGDPSCSCACPTGGSQGGFGDPILDAADQEFAQLSGAKIGRAHV